MGMVVPVCRPGSVVADPLLKDALGSPVSSGYYLLVSSEWDMR